MQVHEYRYSDSTSAIGKSESSSQGKAEGKSLVILLDFIWADDQDISRQESRKIGRFKYQRRFHSNMNRGNISHCIVLISILISSCVLPACTSRTPEEELEYFCREAIVETQDGHHLVRRSYVMPENVESLRKCITVLNITHWSIMTPQDLERLTHIE
ncbi:hypothetical protein BVX94_02330 [bacterium B17]|nr:hypothetical protein BVX94_02330 [bacterium B17]